MKTHRPGCGCVICRRHVPPATQPQPLPWRNFIAAHGSKTAQPPPETPDLGNAIVAVAQALHHLAYEIAKLDLRKK